MTSPESLPMVRRVLAVITGVLLLAVAACGAAQQAGSSGTTRPADRYAVTKVVHTTDGEQARVTLQAVTEQGDVVMTAIGSDVDTGETSLGWTTMRQALFVQLGAAMKALGWEQVSTGPDWWQARYRGGPDAKIATIEPGEPTQEPRTSSTPPSRRSTASPAPSSADTGPVDLVRLIGRSIDDPLVRGMFVTCRIPQSSGDIDCASQGFRLMLGSSMTVVGITLHGDYGSSVWATYAGQLPLGLTWADTYETILSKLGQPERRAGGLGDCVTLEYTAGEGNVVGIELSAFHDRPDALAGSTIMRINITPR